MARVIKVHLYTQDELRDKTCANILDTSVLKMNTFSELYRFSSRVAVENSI